MRVTPLKTKLPVTVATLVALGIMLFLFFMQSPLPDQTLEFCTTDGNGIGSFRVNVKEVKSFPPYMEIKIMPEDMESFRRFLSQFRNRPVTATIPFHGNYAVIPGKDIQSDGTLRVLKN